MKTLHATNPLTKGKAVLTLQKLLARKGFKVDQDGVFGPATQRAVVAAKKALRYPKAQQIPQAGDKLVAKLKAYKPPKRKAAAVSAKERMREKIVAYCKWGIANEPAIHYAQVRPMPIGEARSLPMRTDCSGFATLAYHEAGAPDPNGLDYNGLGYTGTMLGHGRPVTKAEARAGDLVVFGAFPGHHVCVVLEPGPDPLLASHGQERGPIAIRFSAEAKFQPPQVSWRDYIGS